MGETGQPASRSILGIALYNPYTATKANSRRFFDWQLGNATQAMYGRRRSLDEYLQLPYRSPSRVSPQKSGGHSGLCDALVLPALRAVHPRTGLVAFPGKAKPCAISGLRRPAVYARVGVSRCLRLDAALQRHDPHRPCRTGPLHASRRRTTRWHSPLSLPRLRWGSISSSSGYSPTPRLPVLSSRQRKPELSKLAAPAPVEASSSK